MNEESPLQRIARLDEIPEGGMVFAYRDGPVEESGILLLAHGVPVAWRNLCRHLAVRLDCERRGEFTAPGSRNLVCQQHGARYDPVSGACLAGPCLGSRLRPLPIRVENGVVFLEVTALGGLFAVAGT
ncbi:MAG: Rieske 2Fe-2S domain-containing protein [Acidobacteriota bacterium]